MAIMTYSKFWYGLEIDTNNIYFDFDEGAGENTAILTSGLYSPEQLALELETQLNNVALTLEFSVTVNRFTRKLVISADGAFDILANTGTHAASGAYSVLGLEFTDKTGASSYTSDNAIGTVYSPQFNLLDYQDPEANQYAVDGIINETGTGRLEVVRYGVKKIMTCTIEFITNNHLASDSYIRTNHRGYEDALLFMQYLVRKGAIEFEIDSEDPDTFIGLILEKTIVDQNGLGFKINEIPDKLGFYTTGLLTFRVLEV